MGKNKQRRNSSGSSTPGEDAGGSGGRGGKENWHAKKKKFSTPPPKKPAPEDLAPPMEIPEDAPSCIDETLVQGEVETPAGEDDISPASTTPLPRPGRIYSAAEGELGSIQRLEELGHLVIDVKPLWKRAGQADPQTLGASIASLTGLNAKLQAQCTAAEWFDDAFVLACEQVLVSGGRNVYFYCNIGRHRSVATAEAVAKRLSEMLAPTGVSFKATHLSLFANVARRKQILLQDGTTTPMPQLESGSSDPENPGHRGKEDWHARKKLRPKKSRGQNHD